MTMRSFTASAEEIATLITRGHVVTAGIGNGQIYLDLSTDADRATGMALLKIREGSAS